MSCDRARVARHHGPMATDTSSSAFRKAIIARTKQAREASGLTQQAVASVLRIPQDRYKQYETRSPLPHEFIGPFCVLARITPEWLLTGRGGGPGSAGAAVAQPARHLDKRGA